MKRTVCKFAVEAKKLICCKLNIGQAVEDSRSEEMEMVEEVRKAHRDWQAALNNFNNAVDPGMVDYAVYSVEAAERKLVYLIKKAKRERIYAQDMGYAIMNELSAVGGKSTEV